MKKLGILIILLTILLCGCSEPPSYETLGDLGMDEMEPSARQICLELPENASVQTMQGSTGKIYLCDGYEIMVETYRSGDLNQTLRNLTGFSKDSLTLVQTAQNGITSYSCAWASVGEAGEQIGRTTILDDGNFHYCLTVTAAAEDAYLLQPVFEALFASFRLESA